MFSNYLRPPVQLLMLAETSLVFLAVFVGVVVRFQGDLDSYSSVHGAVWPKAFVVTLVVLASLAALGLYQLNQRLYFKDTLARVGVALVFAGLALSALWYVVPNLTLGRGVAGVTVLVLFGGLLLTRFIFLRTVDENSFRLRTLVVGTGDKSAAIQEIRRRADRRGFRIIGNICTSGEGETCSISNCLGHDRSILELALENHADEIVVAMGDRRGCLPIEELLACKVHGIDVLDLLAFMEREAGKIRIDLVNPSWFVFSSGFRISMWRHFTKRAVDLFVAGIGLVATAPVLLLAAVAIRIEDGWRAPILYRQTRVGFHGRTFDILKFRSMVENAEFDGEARWAEKDDPRITRVGRVLRKLRIDELPQIINVFQGKMSLVGPRPERPEFVNELAKTIPFYPERHTVKPGITGWAQLKYQYGSSEQDAVEKLQYDLFYVKNHNLLLDLAIMLQTAEVILWGKGAR